MTGLKKIAVISLLAIANIPKWNSAAVSVDDEVCAQEFDDDLDDEFDWVDLSEVKRNYYESIGWTQKHWDSGVYPYYVQGWDELGKGRQDALITLGWTKNGWENANGWGEKAVGETIPWRKLSHEQRTAAEYLGYNAINWHAHEWGKDFNPTVTHLSIPELEVMGLDYLGQQDVEVELRDGNTLQDDEFGERRTMSMTEYMRELKNGTMLYLKYEDYDVFKEHIRAQIGSKVLTYLREALNKSPLAESGVYKKEYNDIETDDYNWLIWVGGTNSSTSMHFDDDAFNFLWVVEGRKRVVLLPNDERTAEDYDCNIEVNGGDHSCWTGEDILNGPLPPHAIEVELGPGDGIAIPYLCWHAVKNLEPTVAYGFRVDAPDEDEDEDEDSGKEKNDDNDDDEEDDSSGDSSDDDDDDED